MGFVLIEESNKTLQVLGNEFEKTCDKNLKVKVSIRKSERVKEVEKNKYLGDVLSGDEGVGEVKYKLQKGSKI